MDINKLFDDLDLFITRLSDLVFKIFGLVEDIMDEVDELEAKAE